MTEEDIQIQAVAKLRALAQLRPATMGALAYLTHIPNGGKRGKREAGRLKAMGVKAGMPDLILPCPRADWTGLAIEVKTQRGRVSPEQLECLEWLEAQGWQTHVARSVPEIVEACIAYLQGAL